MIYAFVTPIVIPLNDPVASLTMCILFLSAVLSLLVLSHLLRKRAKNAIFYVSHILNIITQIVNMIGLIVSEEPFVSFGQCLVMTCALFVCLSQIEILRLFSPFLVSGKVVNRIWVATWVIFTLFGTPIFVYNVTSFIVDCPAIFGLLTATICLIPPISGLGLEVWQTILIVKFLKSRFAKQNMQTQAKYSLITRVLIVSTLVSLIGILILALAASGLLGLYRLVVVKLAFGLIGFHMYFLFWSFNIVMGTVLESSSSNMLHDLEPKSISDDQGLQVES